MSLKKNSGQIESRNKAINKTKTVPFQQEQEVAILMYHGTPNVEKYPSDVSMKDFKQQINHLLNNGYNVITMAQYQDSLKGTKLPSKPVLITFDDGYDNNYQAFNFLKEKNIPATFFIHTLDHDPKYANLRTETIPKMSVEQIREIAQTNGFEIGSHSVTHQDLTKLTPKKLKQELTDSKIFLERATGEKVDTVAYPLGAVDQRVVEVAKTLYQNGFAVGFNGDVSYKDLNNFAAPRIGVGAQSTFSSVRSSVNRDLGR
jgi:peptidoglycan/xylan/chitin deacetylase (PgdA/CDA1 family)